MKTDSSIMPVAFLNAAQAVVIVMFAFWNVMICLLKFFRLSW